MDDKNRSYVSLVSQLDCYWGFYVPCHATRISEVLNEFVQIAENVYFRDDRFIQVNEISANIVALPRDTDVDSILGVDGEYSPVATTSTNISGTDGLSFEEFRKGINEVSFPPDSVPYLRKTRTCDVRVNTFIDGSDRYVSRNTPEHLRTWSRTDQSVLDVGPFEDALAIQIKHTEAGKNVPTSSEFGIVVWTYTDIWFENTEIGRRNRKRLSKYLTYLAEELDVAYTEHDSNYYQSQMDGFIQPSQE